MIEIAGPLATLGGIILGGGSVAAYFRYKLAMARLTRVEEPASDQAVLAAGKLAENAQVAAANDLLMRQLDSQELRHERERKEYRSELNSLRETVSGMGVRLDSLRVDNERLSTDNAQLNRENTALRIENADLLADLHECQASAGGGRRLDDVHTPVPVVVVEPSTDT